MRELPWLAELPVSVAVADDGLRPSLSWLAQAFANRVVVSGKPIFRCVASGIVTGGSQAIADHASAAGGEVLLVSTRFMLSAGSDQDAQAKAAQSSETTDSDSDEDDADVQTSYGWADAFLDVSCRRGITHVTGLATSRERLAAVVDPVRDLLRPVPLRAAKPSFYVLSSSDGTLYAHRLHAPMLPLVRANYPQPVLAAFDHAVEDLASDSPCGRLVVIDGPPGTGKTHLVRGMVSGCPKALFVGMAPSLVGALTGPQLVPVLLRERIRAGGSAFVLVVEDADQSMAPRAMDNVTSVTALLNVSDGIIGEAINLRVVVTTNSKATDLDAALLRPGRLCRRIHVPPLSASQANDVCGRLGGAARFSREATLAEAYRLAREPADGHAAVQG